MITKVVHGWRPAGLLAYELALGPLVAAVQAAAVAAGLPAGAPRSAASKGMGVWVPKTPHTSRDVLILVEQSLEPVTPSDGVRLVRRRLGE